MNYYHFVELAHGTEDKFKSRALLALDCIKKEIDYSTLSTDDFSTVQSLLTICKKYLSGDKITKTEYRKAFKKLEKITSNASDNR